MRLVSLKCPECGAAIQSPQQANTTTCDYCGITCQVRRRTAFFERPAPLPVIQAGAARLPIAVQKHSITWLIVTIGILIATTAALPLCIINRARSHAENPDPIYAMTQAAKRPQRPAMTWNGVGGLLLADLNDDGKQDVIGRVRVEKGKRLAMAAFDGATGQQLWRSKSFGDRNRANRSAVGLTPYAVIVGDGSSGVTAFAAKDGTTTWTLRLDEIVKSVCAGDTGSVLLQTADHKQHPVNITTGERLPSIGKRACQPLPSDHLRADGPHRITSGWQLKMARARGEHPEGMRSRDAILHVPSQTILSLGTRHPGTPVPMIARLQPTQSALAQAEQVRTLQQRMAETSAPRDKRAIRKQWMAARKRISKQRSPVQWIVTVPSIDPLSVAARPPEAQRVDLNSDVVVVAYQTKRAHRYRLAAFDLETGDRKWDIELDDQLPLSRVMVSPTHAFVSRWNGLRAFDLATGTLAYSL